MFLETPSVISQASERAGIRSVVPEHPYKSVHVRA